MLTLLRILLFLVMIGSSLGLTYSLLETPQAEWQSIPSGAAVSLITASIAGLVALSATESFNVTRQREAEAALRAQREELYTRLLRHLTACFAGGNPPESEIEVRAGMAVWASEDLIDELAEWNRRTGRIMSQHGGAVPVDERPQLQEMLGRIAILARKDLAPRPSGRKVTAQQIAKMVFNDFRLPPEEPIPSQGELESFGRIENIHAQST